MNTITIEKKWSGENLTNRTGGDGPGSISCDVQNKSNQYTELKYVHNAEKHANHSLLKSKS